MKPITRTLLRILAFLLVLAVSGSPAIGNGAEDGPTARDRKRLEEFRTERDIVYKTVNGQALDMILFLPKNETPGGYPVMLYTHGGGWGGGDKFKLFRAPFLDALRHLLNHGIACATIEYRLTQAGSSTAVDCVTDCKDAARFLVKHAGRYGLDTARMGVWGGSAGGHLSLMTGLADNALFPGDPTLAGADPQFLCIVAYYPAVSFLKPELSKGSNFERPRRYIPMLGGPLEENRDVAALISPVEHLRKESPHILLLHGDQDSVLPIAHSRYFMEVARERGAETTLLTVRGGGHSFQGEHISPSMPEINRRVAEFILSELKDES
jgi:acetyl esterase/lipase